MTSSTKPKVYTHVHCAIVFTHWARRSHHCGRLIIYLPSSCCTCKVTYL